MDSEQLRGIMIVSEGSRTFMRSSSGEVDITPMMSGNYLLEGGCRIGKSTLMESVRDLIDEELSKDLKEKSLKSVSVLVGGLGLPSYASLLRSMEEASVPSWHESPPFKLEVYENSENWIPDFLDFDKHNHLKFKFEDLGYLNSSVSSESQQKRRQKSLRAKTARKIHRRGKK